MGNVVNVSRIYLLAKKNKMAEKKRVTAPILNPDRWPETRDFFGAFGTIRQDVRTQSECKVASSTKFAQCSPTIGRLSLKLSRHFTYLSDVPLPDNLC